MPQWQSQSSQMLYHGVEAEHPPPLPQFTLQPSNLERVAPASDTCAVTTSATEASRSANPDRLRSLAMKTPDVVRMDRPRLPRSWRGRAPYAASSYRGVIAAACRKGAVFPGSAAAAGGLSVRAASANAILPDLIPRGLCATAAIRAGGTAGIKARRRRRQRACPSRTECHHGSYKQRNHTTSFHQSDVHPVSTKGESAATPYRVSTH